MTVNKKRRSLIGYVEKYATQTESRDIHTVPGSISPAHVAYQQDSEQVTRGTEEGRKSEVTTNRTTSIGKYTLKDRQDVRDGMASGMTHAEIGLVIGRTTKSVEQYIHRNPQLRPNFNKQQPGTPILPTNIEKRPKLEIQNLDVFDDMISVSEERVTKLKALRQAFSVSDNPYIRESLLSLAENLNCCGTL